MRGQDGTPTAAARIVNTTAQLQPMFPPKRFDMLPLSGGCSEGLNAFRYFFKVQQQLLLIVFSIYSCRPSGLVGKLHIY